MPKQDMRRTFVASEAHPVNAGVMHPRILRRKNQP
jgi:hypothetical protein